LFSQVESSLALAVPARLLDQERDSMRDLLMNVTSLLVPELQRRGRFRTHYEGGNLRENLAT